MECSSCGAKNPSKKKFCGECGAQLVRERPHPAQPEGTPRRGVPGVIWLLIGAVLVALLILLLMWMGIVNVPGRLAFPGPAPSPTGRSYFEAGAPRPTSTPRTGGPSNPTSTPRPPTARPAAPTPTRIPISDIELVSIGTCMTQNTQYLGFNIRNLGPDAMSDLVPVSCVSACLLRDEGVPPPYPGAWDLNFIYYSPIIDVSCDTTHVPQFQYCIYHVICCVDIGARDPNSNNNCKYREFP